MIKNNLLQVLHEIDKDIEDLEQIIPKCNKKILNDVIEEVLNRNDLFESKKVNLKRN